MTNGITIYVEDTGKTFHTVTDWDLGLGNNNYIGDPEMETTYISIPGRDGLLDASEAVTGRRIYKRRELAFEMGGIHPRLNWDAIISGMRNEIEGRVCHLILDNDSEYYWRGRIYIQGFDRFRSLGTFTLAVPNADPYKYEVHTSAEPWLWDPFNFETGVITQDAAHVVVGSEIVTIPHGHMPTYPELVVSDKISGTFSVEFEGTAYQLAAGSNKIPAIIVGGDKDAVLTFMGTATVQIVYRGGSL